MGNKNYTKYSENSKNNKPSMNADELLNVLTSNEATDLGEIIQEGLEAGVNNVIEPVNNTEPANNIEPANDENNENNENNKDENEEDIEKSANDEIVDAVVTGCNKLYVREEPSKESKHLCIIENGTELTVNLTESTDTFYKVHGVLGETLIAGYCMKEFISIK